MVQISSNACAMDVLRARIRSQTKAVAEHIAADQDAQVFQPCWRFGPVLERFAPAEREPASQLRPSLRLEPCLR